MVIWGLEEKFLVVYGHYLMLSKDLVEKNEHLQEGCCLAFQIKADFSKKATRAGMLLEDMSGLIGNFSDI